MTLDSPRSAGDPPGNGADAESRSTGGAPSADPAVEPEARAPSPTAADDEIIGVRRGMFGVTGTGDTSGYGRLVRTVSLPGSTPPPYGSYFDDLVLALRKALGEKVFGAAIEKIVVFAGELTLHVRRERVLETARALRDDPALRFELCLGVDGVHYPDDTGRELHACYHLLSITHNRRVRVEVSVPDADPHLPSLFSVYPTTDWHERETYDFFGIVFDGHPSLTRIMMPDDWRGHPQRKDYPLGGIPVEYKGARIPPPDQRRAYS
ncbi:NADH-quinone oxidoreductase subunit C [Nocardia veterana]|uniref:NADH-quinone oxidoreductase subunit C n=2 Tax=Nocardia veterana TaxID=132249 RepID=A0A7X6LVG2_9NOCA|nr:NADH-quinone oxidoreductase subunit C [Nocardia veterana]NKY85263.1 NADH-quinone oxidoreductase subunit C [Nocardia veterana]